MGAVDTIEWHVYCVAITFKMTEQVDQWICIKFRVKLQHSSMETICTIQKAAAMGKWWLAASSQQHTCSFIRSHAEFFWWNIKLSRWLSPATAHIWCLRLLAFLKLKSPLKGNRFQTISEIQENMTGQLMVIGRTVWGPKVPTLKGTEASLSYVQCFFYLLQ